MNSPSRRADASVETQFGWITLEFDQTAIRRLSFADRPPALSEQPGSDAHRAGVRAVRRFLERGGRVAGSPPLKLRGTPFQQKVWAALRQIPPGTTRTYGELARQLGTAPRAIGGACRANPVLLFVPCHRVVAASGAGGFAGRTAGRWMEIKRWLLSREGVRLD